MEELSRVRQVIDRLRRERGWWEDRVMRVGPFVEGSLVEQYRTCGKAGCRCKRGEKHGPYHYLSQKVDGRTRMRYVAKKEVRQLKVLLRRHRELRQARQRIRELTGEIEELFDVVERLRRVEWGEAE